MTAHDDAMPEDITDAEAFMQDDESFQPPHGGSAVNRKPSIAGSESDPVSVEPVRLRPAGSPKQTAPRFDEDPQRWMR